MLKNYIVNGLQFQFEEGKQPAGAVEAKPPEKAAQPENREAKPANRAGKVKTK